MIDRGADPLVRWGALYVRPGLRIGLAATATLTAAAVLYVSATLPRPSITLESTAPSNHVAGAYHIHTSRSDGTGSVAAVALAASRAGLQFIILTDHGDGMRAPDAPAYIHGVLTIDAVEINTREGHVVAIGLDAASPYPLAGLAQDVIADIHRMGGIAILAHPDSPRAELSWRGQGMSDADGLEWINADSEWRDESAPRLVQVALSALVRPPEAIASMFSRPVRSFQRWDRASRVGATVGLAAVDAHANIPWREQEEPRQSSGFERPSYETMFRAITQTVVAEHPLTGNASVDAAAIISALRAGRTYSTIRAQAWPATLLFDARREGVSYAMGDRLDESAAAVSFTARVPNAPGSQVTLLRNGQPHRTGQGGVAVPDASTPGVYRVEVRLPDTEVPWIVSNAITIDGDMGGPPFGRGGGRGAGGGDGPAAPAGIVELHPVVPDAGRWVPEHDASSGGTIALDDEGRIRFEYRLGTGTPRGQYAAMAFTPDAEAGVETLSFTASASAPVRVSVQIRLPDGHGSTAQRWRKSIYIDETSRPFVLRLQDFEPADRPTARRPIVTPIQSLLVVMDTVNSRPGAAGTVWLSELALGVNRLE